MPDFNKLSKPGLIPVKVENQGSLITTQVNKINFTGSGVTASVGQFNDLTILITGGGGSGVSSSYALIVKAYCWVFPLLKTPCQVVPPP